MSLPRSFWHSTLDSGLRLTSFPSTYDLNTTPSSDTDLHYQARTPPLPCTLEPRVTELHLTRCKREYLKPTRVCDDGPVASGKLMQATGALHDVRTGLQDELKRVAKDQWWAPRLRRV